MAKPYLIDIYRDPTGLRVRILNGADKSILAVLPRAFKGSFELRKNLESLESSLTRTIANLETEIESASHD